MAAASQRWTFKKHECSRHVCERVMVIVLICHTPHKCDGSSDVIAFASTKNGAMRAGGTHVVHTQVQRGLIGETAFADPYCKARGKIHHCNDGAGRQRPFSPVRCKLRIVVQHHFRPIFTMRVIAHPKRCVMAPRKPGLYRLSVDHWRHNERTAKRILSNLNIMASLEQTELVQKPVAPQGAANNLASAWPTDRRDPCAGQALLRSRLRYPP